MRENRVVLEAGAMVMTDDGTALVMHVDRAGVELRDVRGELSWVEWPDLRTAVPIDSEHETPEPASLRSFSEAWHRIDDEARAEALHRLGVVQELTTGFRHGHRELALPGEPSDLFDPALGTSLTARCRRMSERLTHEATNSRTGSPSGAVSVRTVHQWLSNWESGGLLGLVDGRRAKTTERFASIPLAWRQAARDVVAELDGDVSTVNQREVHRRIKVALKEAGLPLDAPQRAAGQYISHLMRSQGTTTRAQRSNKIRGVSGTQSYPAMIPGQVVAIDMTRADAMVWCPVRGGACSVEIISAMDVATRVIVALRVVPMSADAYDASMLMYDVMRPFSQVVDGTEVSDWAWAGVPEQIDFYSDVAGADPDYSGVEVSCPRSCRQVNTAPGLQGTHTVPGVQPSAIRADHGSIFVSRVFRDLLGRFGIDLPLSRTRRPVDNGILERYHETLQRGLQQLPGFKGRNPSERGRKVGLPGSHRDEPLLTAPELERWLRRWVALEYHRTPHTGLRIPGAEGIDLRPIEMFDALLKLTGRLHVPQRPDLIYDFLPVRWGTVRAAGVEFTDLVYDGAELDEFRRNPVGAFRDQDAAMPFMYDPHDVTRIWFRHPATGRVVEVPWRKAHMVDAPLTEMLVREVRGLAARRPGGARLNRKIAEDEIIAELGTLLDGVVPKQWRARIGAARQRFESARRDHTETQVAMTVAEMTEPEAQPAPPIADAGEGDSFSIWAESWPYTPHSDSGGEF